SPARAPWGRRRCVSPAPPCSGWGRLDCGTRILLGPRAPRIAHVIRERAMAGDRRKVDRAAAMAAAAVCIELLSSSGPGRALDRRLFRAMNRGGGPHVDRFLTGITELGSITASAGAAAVLSAAGHRRTAARGLAAAGTMWLVGQGL